MFRPEKSLLSVKGTMFFKRKKMCETVISAVSTHPSEAANYAAAGKSLLSPGNTKVFLIKR